MTRRVAIAAGIALACAVSASAASSAAAAGAPAGSSKAAADAKAPAPKAGDMVKVAAGEHVPVYPPSPEEAVIPMKAFELDRLPVTNRDYLAFVTKHPKWRRGRVPGLLADHRYLEHWKGPLEIGAEADPDAPVTRVSWFAAKAYCEAQGKRLPTENEWEYAAAASATSPNGRSDPAFTARLLEWYSKPTPKVFPKVARGEPNYWGLHDMHGLVWEWVLDFGSTMVSSDSREDGDPDKMRFCGASAINAGDKDDYAAFMRYAFRSSLQGPYTVGNLGFRCAR